MLTADLAMSWRRGERISPRYLDVEEQSYVQAAEELIALVREHEGLRRGELDGALDDYIGIGTDYRIMRGLIKLLTDRCEFETASPVEPSQLRSEVFLAARQAHPVQGAARETILIEASQRLGCKQDELLESLYADLTGNQRLTTFADLSPDELLDQYNLAQAQALLYRCSEMTIMIRPQTPAGYRKLFDAVKHYRLIHTIKGRASAGYEIRLSGPVSLFHRSLKYGVRMAVFLPALLECEKWSMKAEISDKNAVRAFFELDSETHRLKTGGWAESAAENRSLEKVLNKWPALGTDWRLERSHEVVDLGEAAAVPDLVAEHPDGRKIMVELLGFWTPRYLQDRLKEFEFNKRRNFVLAASEELLGAREAPVDLPPNVLLYKATLDARALLNLIEKLDF